MNTFNYEEVDLLDDYDEVKNISGDVQMKLGVMVDDPEESAIRLEWLEENLGAIKAGYKDKKEWEEDNMDTMYPDGYDEDADGNIFDDD